MEEKIKLKAQLQLAFNQAYANDIQMYNQYVGKKIVIEEGELGGNVSVGMLKRNGTQNIELYDYEKHDCSLTSFKDYMKNPEMYVKLLEPEFRLLKRIINKSQIASVQSLEEILIYSNKSDSGKL